MGSQEKLREVGAREGIRQAEEVSLKLSR